MSTLNFRLRQNLTDSADLGGGSAHSSRDVRMANPEKEVERSLASRAPTHNEYTELPASSKPHRLPISPYSNLSCAVSEILRVFGLLTPPLFHPNFGVFGVPVAPDRPYWGQRAHISLKLFGREIISEEFKPI